MQLKLAYCARPSSPSHITRVLAPGIRWLVETIKANLQWSRESILTKTNRSHLWRYLFRGQPIKTPSKFNKFGRFEDEWTPKTNLFKRKSKLRSSNKTSSTLNSVESTMIIVEWKNSSLAKRTGMSSQLRAAMMMMLSNAEEVNSLRI